MPEAWAECSIENCHNSCGASEEFCPLHRETMRTGEPMDIAWQLLKAWPDPPEEGEKERLPVSALLPT